MEPRTEPRMIAINVPLSPDAALVASAVLYEKSTDHAGSQQLPYRRTCNFANSHSRLGDRAMLDEHAVSVKFSNCSALNPDGILQGNRLVMVALDELIIL
jgi:hypothetical protein